jgi:glucosamine--fructose-6-phosphate aminotransferase (isomerizing)
LQRRPPQVVVTCARGSSAHAAAFGKHLIERYAGIPVSPAAPSIASIYGQEMHLKDQLMLAISQSGRSDDLIAMTASAKQSGALTVAITNAADSPLAQGCDFVLPICAGPELSVAATKTFIATAVALARLTAAWTKDGSLDAAIGRLPERLAAAAALDWSAVLPVLAKAGSLVTIGRGSTLAIAREAALKLKETCNRHAEGFPRAIPSSCSCRPTPRRPECGSWLASCAAWARRCLLLNKATPATCGCRRSLRTSPRPMPFA